MKAVVLEKPQTLTYTDVDQPTPAPGEALIQTSAASICGSDVLRVFHGHAKTYPLILGHEVAGVVAAVGDGVDKNLVGGRVAIAPLIPCMQCDPCQRGLYATCQNYSFIGSRQSGGFAEYFTAPAVNLVPLPDDVPVELASLVEPTTVALHALKRAGDVEGKSVAVVGAGSIGLLTVQMAKFKGASTVVATDIVDANLDLAQTFGADVTFNPANMDAVTAVRDYTNGGADVTLEVSGAPPALEQALHITAPDGHVVLIGNQPQDKTLSLALIEHVMRQELNLHGTWMSYSAPFPGDEWTDALRAMQQHPDTLRQMISHRVALPDLPAAFNGIHNQTDAYRKVVVDYEA